MTETYCPTCGFQSASDLRYCRKCGTSLETVRRALADPAARTRIALETPGRSTLAAFFEVGPGWELVRGIATLAIAVPAFLFFTVVLGFSANPWVTATQVTFLVFLLLGARDLVRVARRLQTAAPVSVTPAAGDAAHREPWKDGPELAPPSVTEHTTFRLDDPTRGPDDDPRSSS